MPLYADDLTSPVSAQELHRKPSNIPNNSCYVPLGSTTSFTADAGQFWPPPDVIYSALKSARIGADITTEGGKGGGAAQWGREVGGGSLIQDTEQHKDM
jgi:hypothetical protein